MIDGMLVVAVFERSQKIRLSSQTPGMSQRDSFGAEYSSDSRSEF